MLRVVFALWAFLTALPALAADKLTFGPEPAWVKPLEVSAPPIGTEGPPFRLLLQDRQLNFSPQGDSEYAAQVVQIRNPQGLAALGTLSLAWNPDTDTVVVHHVRIIRDGKPIDILARQAFTVLRREANLERAMIDGVLTATLQPEGLQVGDVVDLAYTLTRFDPVLAGRSERATSLIPFLKADRLRIRATWDAKRPLQWRASPGLEKPKVTTSGGKVEVAVDLKDAEPLRVPLGAPQRFTPLRELSVSQFGAWAEVSGLMAPYFARTSVLKADSPLKAEVAKIRAVSSDPEVQAAAALKLVQDQVRYLALVLNLGGYIPTDADLTWERRYGDCKAKTVLLMALLRELGIESEAALVSATRGDGLDARLPSMGAFDHVIVRAVIGGKVYWLDGTRTGDRSLKTLRVPPFQWALPLREPGADLVAMIQPPLTRPDTFVRLTIDASAGLDVPAPTRGEITLDPNLAALFAMGSSGIPGFDRDKTMRALWSTYPWIEVKTVTWIADTAEDPAKITMEGLAKLPFEGGSGGRTLRIRAAELGARGLPERPEDAPFPEVPFAVAGYPGYESFNLTLTLPRGGDGFAFDAPEVDLTLAGRAYTRKSRIEKAKATIETTRRSLVGEISVAEANAAKASLDKLAEVRVLLRAPVGYRPTDQDVAAWKAQTPKTVQGFVERGSLFLNDGKNDLAMADFTKAVELDPASSLALANRALGHFYGGRTALAKADVAKAQALDPRDTVALHGAGLIAMREGRYADAATAFGRAADLRAGNAFALAAQAGAYMAMNETDKALGAAAELDRLVPDRTETRLLRFEIYNNAGQRENALAEIDKALARTPEDARLLLIRASTLAQLGRRAEADKAFARVIEVRPSVEAYLTRAVRRPRNDVTGKLADIQAAEALEPGLVGVAARRAEVLGEAGRYPEAMTGLNAALKANAGNIDLLFARADIQIRAGRADQATKDFAAIRAKAAEAPDQLNGLCWQQAIRNVALETALADCDAALKLAPGHSNAVDSRAFVLMRLGRLDEALTAYDAAVKLRPRQAESLFGRGLTRLRLNQAAEGRADLATARTEDPEIDATFASYGLIAPPAS